MAALNIVTTFTAQQLMVPVKAAKDLVHGED